MCPFQVQRDLPGQENQVAGTHRLRIGPMAAGARGGYSLFAQVILRKFGGNVRLRLRNAIDLINASIFSEMR